MTTYAKQSLRVILAFILGLFAGCLFGVCLLFLTVAVCAADGGGFDREPNHAWVKVVTTVGYVAGLMVVPPIGATLGVVWAIRRNRRDDAVVQNTSP